MIITKKKPLGRNVILIFLLLIKTGLAQPTAELNLSKIDYKQVESLFLQKLNKHREEKGLGKLQTDEVLRLAANDQAKYMDSTRVVGHIQKIKGKEAPQNRVRYYKGTHGNIGENCILIYLKKPMQVKYSKTPITVNTVEQAAEALFLGWKNSPGHYKNMIEPSFDVGSLGFSFSADSSALYCAQVFAAKPFIPLKGLESPLDAYGIKDENPKTCGVFKSPQFEHIMQTTTFVIMDNDSMGISSEDYPALKAFFNQPKDAVYLDIVLREQFVCANNNLLHGSDVYDGTMLPPVYFKDLYKRNEAVGEKNFFAVLCKIPSTFKNYKYEVNHGFIKENVACKYIWRRCAPEKNLQALPLYPKWVKLTNENIEADSFSGELYFNIPFGRGKTTLYEEEQIQLRKRLEIYRPFLKEVTIKTYSSVDGPTSINIRIQQERAEALKMEIEKTTGKLSAIEIESKENWDDFYKQIENSPFRRLKELPKEKVKEILKNRKMLDSMDYLLGKTRIAQVRVRLEATIDNNSSPYLILGAYKKAVLARDSLKSFRYQNKLVQAVLRKELTHGDVIQVELPYEKKFLAHWTNYIALAMFDPELIYSHETRQLAIKAMNLDTTYAPLQFNMCITSLKFMNDYMDTLMQIPMLERKMKNCSIRMKSKEDSILVKKMMLNYHIISAYHHWLVHEYDKITPHVESIRNYFEASLLTEKEAIELALMFNFYRKFDWTNELLTPFIKKGTNNEDLLFLFIQTNASAYGTAFNQEEWIALLQKAKKMNVKRFYKWIDVENFQLMRLDDLKKEFCDIDLKNVK